MTGTNLVSTPDGVTPADGASAEPAISSDGRFVAFDSTATTLITGVGPTQEVYVRDTCTGAATTPACVPSTHLISTPNGTTPANALSEHPSINKCGTSTTDLFLGPIRRLRFPGVQFRRQYCEWHRERFRAGYL